MIGKTTLDPAQALSSKKTIHFSKGNNLHFSVYTYDDISDISYHDHSGDIELALVLHGYGYHYINHQVREVTTGDVVLIDPKSCHSFFPVNNENSTRLQVLNCVFSIGVFDRIGPNFPQLSAALAFLCEENSALNAIDNHLPRDVAEFCAPLLTYMDRLDRMDPMLHSDSLCLTLSSILLEIYRFFSNQQKSKSSPYEEPLVAEAMQFIQAHYLEPDFMLSMVYDHLYVSKAHLCTAFRKHTGSTPIRYLNQLRIQQACALIQDGYQSVYTLPALVGYSEYNTFYINFKKFTGFSLRDYLKALNICMPAVRGGVKHKR